MPTCKCLYASTYILVMPIHANAYMLQVLNKYITCTANCVNRYTHVNVQCTHLKYTTFITNETCLIHIELMIIVIFKTPS